MYYNNKRLALSIFWLVLGAVLLVLSVTEVVDSGLCGGFGGALIAVGALQISRNLKYRKDPAYREKVDTELKDERNGFLRMKSWTWAGTVVVIVEGVGAIAALVMGARTVQLVLSFSVWLIVASYWVSYLVLSRKY